MADKHRGEDQPHPASVLRIGPGLEDASIHHDHLANLKPSSGQCLVDPKAAGRFLPGGGQLHVGRADDDELMPTRANVN